MLTNTLEQSFNCGDVPVLITCCKPAWAWTAVHQHSFKLGRAGVHFLLTAVPEVWQAIVFVGTEVGKVSEEAVGKLLIPKHPCPPGLGQHSVVGPVVANTLLPAKQPLAVRSGGVPPSALLPTWVLPFQVRQLQEDGAWKQRWTLIFVGFYKW